WSTIARYLPGRTDNEIKNYWRTHYEKKEKSTLKQQKRKAEILKLKQQQQQEKPDKDEGEDGKVNSEAVEITNHQSEGKQQMVFMYPSSEDQCLAMMSQEPANAASWIDQYLVDEGLWSGLWNLDDDHHQPGNCCNKIAMQSQADTAYNNSFGGMQATCTMEGTFPREP
ncbi:hypothetical protein Goarm_018998, partial [Gossypium armourianum]|nr:hypothetical protein [Gossypium armourianum]